MPRVLITGGAGFIGAAVARAWRARHPDMDVRVFDVTPPRVEGVVHVRGDVLDAGAVARAMDGCDHVMHFAAQVGVAQTERAPDLCMQVNLQGTRNVLAAARRAGVRRLLFASSSEVYGDAPEQPIAESSAPRPKSVYAESKLLGEQCVAAYRERDGVDWRVVRFFNVYGARQRSAFVVPRFVDAVVRGQAPVIYGPGTQVRSYCHVDDAARGCLLALLSRGARGWIFNIGNSAEPISVEALARRVIALGEGRVAPRFVSFTDSDRADAREIWRRIPRTERAAAELGFVARVSLDEGLRRVLAQRRAGAARPLSDDAGDAGDAGGPNGLVPALLAPDI